MRNQQAAVCPTTVVAAVTEKMVSLPTFIRMEIVSVGSPLTGHLLLWDNWRGWTAMAQRCHQTMHLEDLPLGRVLEWFPACPNV